MARSDDALGLHLSWHFCSFWQCLSFHSWPCSLVPWTLYPFDFPPPLDNSLSVCFNLILLILCTLSLGDLTHHIWVFSDDAWICIFRPSFLNSRFHLTHPRLLKVNMSQSELITSCSTLPQWWPWSSWAPSVVRAGTPFLGTLVSLTAWCPSPPQLHLIPSLDFLDC